MATTASARSARCRLAALVLRWRGIATIVWMGAAAIGTALILAWKFTPRLNGIEGRLNATTARADVTDARVNTMQNSQAVLVKSACLDRTKFEQQMISMTCPDSLYKRAHP